MKNYGIDDSWIKAGLNINLVDNIMQIISRKRENVVILPEQTDILNASTTLHSY